MAQTVKRLPTMRETWVQSLGWEELLEKEMATNSSWTEKPGGYSPWSRKELDMTGPLSTAQRGTDKGCLIPLTEDTCNRQIHGVRKYTGRRQGPEDVGMRS